MKVVSVELQSAISIHGTKVLGAITINSDKYPGIAMELSGQILLIKLNNKVGFTPIANIKGGILTLEESDGPGSKSAPRKG